MIHSLNLAQREFGDIDIYIFDQILKGRFQPHHKIIDMGCGNGRNLYYFLKNQYWVCGVDYNDAALNEAILTASQLHPKLPTTNFQLNHIIDAEFEAESFDWVICNAVLHFAQNRSHFEEILFKMWAFLKPKGRFIARVASNIGIENNVTPIENGRHRLANGIEWFLVNEALLLEYSKKLNGQLFEPLKTTNVQNMRCMTTWCLEKL